MARSSGTSRELLDSLRFFNHPPRHFEHSGFPDIPSHSYEVTSSENYNQSCRNSIRKREKKHRLLNLS